MKKTLLLLILSIWSAYGMDDPNTVWIPDAQGVACQHKRQEVATPAQLTPVSIFSIPILKDPYGIAPQSTMHELDAAYVGELVRPNSCLVIPDKEDATKWRPIREFNKRWCVKIDGKLQAIEDPAQVFEQAHVYTEPGFNQRLILPEFVTETPETPIVAAKGTSPYFVHYLSKYRFENNITEYGTSFINRLVRTKKTLQTLQQSHAKVKTINFPTMKVMKYVTGAVVAGVCIYLYCSGKLGRMFKKYTVANS